MRYTIQSSIPLRGLRHQSYGFHRIPIPWDIGGRGAKAATARAQHPYAVHNHEYIALVLEQTQYALLITALMWSVCLLLLVEIALTSSNPATLDLQR